MHIHFPLCWAFCQRAGECEGLLRQASLSPARAVTRGPLHRPAHGAGSLPFNNGSDSLARSPARALLRWALHFHYHSEPPAAPAEPRLQPHFPDDGSRRPHDQAPFPLSKAASPGGGRAGRAQAPGPRGRTHRRAERASGPTGAWQQGREPPGHHCPLIGLVRAQGACAWS